jgi:hypothetical protein
MAMKRLVGVVVSCALGANVASGQPAASPSDQAIARVLRTRKLERAKVTVEDVGEDAQPAFLRGKKAADAADGRRMVTLGAYLEGHEQGEHFGIVAVDRRGRYVLLRPRPNVVDTVIVHRDDCSGVMGVRLQTVRRIAVLPKGAALHATVDVPFDHVQLVESRPESCNTIP